MDNKVKISVFIIIACLVAIAGINGYRYFTPSEADEESNQPFFPFNNSSLTITEDGQQPLQEEIVLQKADFEDLSPEKLTSEGMVKPIFSHTPLQLQERIEEEPPVAAAAATRAQRTSSYQQFMDFQDNPTMRAFHADMQKALKGKVKEEDLRDPQVLMKLISDPQISQILLKYSKDPAFADIMSNAMKEQELISTFGNDQSFFKQNTQESLR